MDCPDISSHTLETQPSRVQRGSATRPRIAYREAAGWLAHAHTWIHSRDLALRDAGLTGSYTAAALAGRLHAELPTMTARNSRPDVVPSDEVVAGALRPRRERRH